MIAFEKIDERISQTLSNGSILNIDLLVLDITKLYPISPRAVEKRVQLYVSANKDNIEIIGREVRLI
jgi:hypothetical protein